MQTLTLICLDEHGNETNEKVWAVKSPGEILDRIQCQSNNPETHQVCVDIDNTWFWNVIFPPPGLRKPYRPQYLAS